VLTYEPGASPAHRLDPRTKLAVQLAFAAAAFVYTTPVGLLALSVVAFGALAAAATPARRTVWEYRFVFPFLLAAPLLEGLTWGTPWFVYADAIPSVLASYRVVLVILVAAAYVRSTPVRDSRAAVQWAVPGKPGQFLGMGVAFVFRFLPLLRADIARIRDAQRARLGTERSVPERMALVTVAAFNRALERADHFALALQARCFAWNPTLPELRMEYRDIPALAVAVGLVAATLHGVI